MPVEYGEQRAIEAVLLSTELGIRVIVTLDPVRYDNSEAEEIMVMFASVLEAYHKRRKLALANPQVYGYEVH